MKSAQHWWGHLRTTRIRPGFVIHKGYDELHTFTLLTGDAPEHDDNAGRHAAVKKLICLWGSEMGRKLQMHMLLATRLATFRGSARFIGAMYRDVRIPRHATWRNLVHHRNSSNEEDLVLLERCLAPVRDLSRIISLKASRGHSVFPALVSVGYRPSYVSQIAANRHWEQLSQPTRAGVFG
jgi:hypothetical protein